jgi:aryl-alcohol dehydrogenase-like predicted oxidoreductase
VSAELWAPARFGKTDLRVSRLGIGSSYGVSGADLERAHERGVNFFFYGLRRRADFGRGLARMIAKDRSKVVVAAQSYTRVASLMRPSLHAVLRTLKTDHVDLLGLGWWNDVPAERILDAARELVREGKVRHLLISSHQRPSLVPMMDVPGMGGIMIRYNAAHTGAEREVFPHVGARDAGVLAFTATRWGGLVDPRMVPPEEPLPRASDCYRFVLTNPAVHSTLCGPRNGAELDEAMAALDRGPMTEDELAWMRRVGAAVRSNASERALGWVDKLVGALRPRRAPRQLAAP